MANLQHDVSVDFVPSRCGAPGHRDVVVKCSCGFEQKHMHGDRSNAEPTILLHRIQAIEEAIGLKIVVKWGRT